MKYTIDANSDTKIKLALGWLTAGKQSIFNENDERVRSAIAAKAKELGIEIDSIWIKEDRVLMGITMNPGMALAEAVAKFKRAVKENVGTGRRLWTRAFFARSSASNTASAEFVQFGERQPSLYPSDAPSAINSLLRKYSKEELIALLESRS